ncbi:MAG TPA: SET domain-containing protein-lysine N-methyltransferase [Chitinophagaceae bacterium]|nr:SET domain-containing protein-lysine N-methyltransferase [Chitinophagaceae bacterium]
MITLTNPQQYRFISDHVFAVVWQNLVNNQKSSFAQQAYMPGDIITPFSGKEVFSKPTYLTLQVDVDRHIMMHPEHLQYINHSCDPNVFFDTYSMQVIALRRIEEGDELSFFYPSTEWDMAQPFKCFCGSHRCLGEIKGAAHINPDVLSNYRLTRFIQQQLHDRSSKEKRA